MPSVLLGGLRASDPAGSRAIRDAVMYGLPNHDVIDLSAPPDLTSLYSCARRSAGIVMAGAAFGPPPRAAAMAVVLSALARRPIAFVGVGTGPLDGARAAALARFVAARAHLLLLGDAVSASHLAAAGVPTPMRVSADPAWLALTPEPRRRGESVVAVLDASVTGRVERSLGMALVTAARAGRPVRLVPWCGAGSPDAAMASRLVRLINAEVPSAAGVEPVPVTLSDMARLCTGAHAVVALRYAAVLAAAAAGVPVVGVGADPRIYGLAAHLRQPVVDPVELETALPITLERIGPASLPAPSVVQEEVDRARAGIRLLRLVFEPGAVGAAELDHLPLVPVPWL